MKHKRSVAVQAAALLYVFCLVVSQKRCTFAAMKLQKYILIEIVMMALATAGLIWLTGSYLMSLGIVILLVIAEHVLVTYMERKQEEKEESGDATTDKSL